MKDFLHSNSIFRFLVVLTTIFGAYSSAFSQCCFPTSGGVISAPSSATTGSTINLSNVSAPTGCPSGSPSYYWVYMCSNCATVPNAWIPLPGANTGASATFTPTEPGAYGFQRCSSCASCCNAATAASQGISLNEGTAVYTNVSGGTTGCTPPSVSVFTTQPTCSVFTGSISISASGSCGTLQYSLDGGATWGSSSFYSGLSVGTYNVRVRCQSNTACVTNYGAVTLSAATGCCTPPSVSVSVTQPTCSVATGSISISASGSGGALQYSINGGTTWSTTSSYSGLAVGTYNVRVRYQAQTTCFTTYGNVTLSAATGCCTPPIVSASTVTQPNCTASTGIIVVNATGSGTLEYSINGGTTWVTTNTFNGLAPGTYTPRVRKQSNPTCSTAGTAVAINTVPVLPDIYTAPTVIHPTCAVPTGTMVVNATGMSTLEYSVDNGATWTTNNTFTGLAPGTLTYYVQVRLQNTPSCVKIYAQNPVVINAVPVLPDIATAPIVTPIDCASSTSGAITISATGSGTLEYSINGGATWQLSNNFTGLSAGSYNVYVRLQSSSSCVKIYGSNPIVLSPPACRDFTPTIEIDNVTFLSNSAPRDFVINVSEIQNGASSGQLVLKIPKISGFTYSFSNTTTLANVSGGTPVTNSKWAKTENAIFVTLTLNPNEVINNFGIATIGMTVVRNTNVPTQTNQPMTATIVDDSGGDTNRFNNTYNLIVKAQ